MICFKDILLAVLYSALLVIASFVVAWLYPEINILKGLENVEVEDETEDGPEDLYLWESSEGSVYLRSSDLLSYYGMEDFPEEGSLYEPVQTADEFVFSDPGLTLIFSYYEDYDGYQLAEIGNPCSEDYKCGGSGTLDSWLDLYSEDGKLYAPIIRYTNNPTYFYGVDYEDSDCEESICSGFIDGTSYMDGFNCVWKISEYSDESEYVVISYINTWIHKDACKFLDWLYIAE
jgi:hypothetical protein